MKVWKNLLPGAGISLGFGHDAHVGHMGNGRQGFTTKTIRG